MPQPSPSIQEVVVPAPAPVRKIDLSLTGRILRLTLPIAVAAQMENLVGLADIYTVGNLGPAAISAVGVSRQIVMVISVVMMSVTAGTLAMVAQATGAGARTDASAAAKQSFTLVSLLSIGISLVGLAVSPTLLTVLSVSPDVVRLGAPYLRIFFAGIVLMTLNYAIITCLQGAGDTRTPLYISLLINAAKILASYLFIFGAWGLPRLGVAGAAVGTLVGRLCGVIAGLWALYSGRFRVALLPGTSYRPDPALARRILRIGIPSALQGFFRNGSGLVFVKLVAMTSVSTAAVAAYAIGNQTERVLHRTSLSFGTTATALVGESLGAGKPDEAELRGWTTLLIAVLTMLVLGIPTLLLAPRLMTLFTDAPDVIRIGTVYLYATVLAEPFMCASIASAGSLRAAGNTLPALYYTLISQWLIRLPVAYLLAFPLGYDVHGLWAALVVFSVLQSLLTARKFARGEWKTMKI
jgi:putative MATE family efflux protein